MKGGYFEDLVKERDYILTLEKDIKEESDLVSFKKQIIEYDYDISKEKQKLTNEEKQLAKEKVIDILNMIENVKLEIIKHLESKEYLKKLAKEMDISKKSANEHVKVRINNIKNISYELTTSSKISGDTDGFGYAYYLCGTNKIALPYNINLKNENEKNYFYEAIVHEVLHESTMSYEGLSATAEEYLRDSFKSLENEEKKDSSYYSRPSELIVRKQILDLNMEKNDIKKYGDKFQEEHYQKLLELKKEGKLTQDESDLIEHIKSEDFVTIMNGLAENKNEAKGDYYNPEWDYGNEDNQA
jgi:hypothetical protein